MTNINPRPGTKASSHTFSVPKEKACSPDLLGNAVPKSWDCNRDGTITLTTELFQSTVKNAYVPCSMFMFYMYCTFLFWVSCDPGRIVWLINNTIYCFWYIAILMLYCRLTLLWVDIQLDKFCWAKIQTCLFRNGLSLWLLGKWTGLLWLLI